MEEKDPIRQFVAALLHEKGVAQDTDTEVLKDIIDTMSGQLEQLINRSILEQLDEQQLKLFEDLVASGAQEDAITAFFSDNNINTRAATARAFQRFRDTYMGSEVMKE